MPPARLNPEKGDHQRLFLGSFDLSVLAGVSGANGRRKRERPPEVSADACRLSAKGAGISAVVTLEAISENHLKMIKREEF